MSNAKILIVEDEGIEALDLQRRLVGLGYPCPEMAASGAEAVAKAAQMSPDLVLMDIMLPGQIDGVTAAGQIRARFDIPVIYLTAYADEATVHRAKVTEPYGYIVKPFQEREVHITIDIALYKHEMERRLKESRQWFATTLRSIGDAVIATDNNGLVTFMNAVAEDLTGWKLEHALSKELAQVFQIINRDTRKSVDNPLSKVLQNGMVVGLANHTLLVARDGREIPIDDSAAPIKDDRGTIIGVVLVFRDVTERQKAEEQMQEANNRLQAQTEELQAQAEELQAQTEELRVQADELQSANQGLRDNEETLRRATERWERTFHSVPDLIVILDDRHCVVQANRAMAERLGVTPAQCVGLPCYKAVHGTDAPPSFCPHLRTLADGRAHVVEVHEDRLGGDFLVSTTPLHNGAGRMIGSVHVARDITERKRTEEALRDLNATLESKVAQRTAQLEYRARQLQKLTLELSQTEDRERKRMADILHDDLQQQLAAAKFRLSLLSNRLKHDPQQQAIAAQVDQMLKEAVEKSRSLSHDLSPAVLYQGDLGQTFEWLARQMQERHGLMVRVDARTEVNPQSDAMKAFLYKAGQELLFNVVKHARVKDAVLRLRCWGRYVGLSVADRGRGFDPHGLKEATGFGLFSIRERVDLLGGHMKIKSAAGQGSAFFIVLPDKASPDVAIRAKHRDVRAPTESPRRDQSVPTAGRRPLRVLLADDHEVVRQGLKGILSEEPDVEVVGEAANGREAVDLAGRLEPDVVIMDVSMPLISGAQATRQIKMHLPNIRVIALSMYDEPETVERMRHAGAEGYMLKTASAEELLAAIRGKRSDS